MKKTKVGPIEKGKHPRQKKESSSIFDDMKEGDSIHYTGARNTFIIKFAYHCAKGLYRTEREGEGWRFYLLKRPKK